MGTAYLSEQYNTELLGTMICFSQTVLRSMSVYASSITIYIDIPVIQKAHGHRVFVFVFNYFLMLNGVRIGFPSVRT